MQVSNPDVRSIVEGVAVLGVQSRVLTRLHSWHGGALATNVAVTRPVGPAASAWLRLTNEHETGDGRTSSRGSPLPSAEAQPAPETRRTLWPSRLLTCAPSGRLRSC
jgi:hypothetical protein